MKLFIFAIAVATAFATAAMASSESTSHKVRPKAFAGAACDLTRRGRPQRAFTPVEQFVHDIVQDLLFGPDDVFERSAQAGYADDAQVT